ncbi:ATP-binding protein [Actinoplanes sichuanensis]|uniref:ATP-binding protein n=1 Tax=Actinoplanes sichuanensis TaxID=512349 RepID=A0ABW4A0B6_9ACTN|nr:LuxR C-terminal-related transcriptional regulator [Actinoplanes sichuanensis]
MGNLSAAVTSFVGRRREIGQVRERLATSRLVTLTGPGGAGKTRLAVEAAGEARRAFPDGVWFVDLAALTEDGRVASAVAAALAIRDQSARPALDRLTEFLTDRQALLLLDNCEHVLDACATLADTVLRHAPGTRILATSRQSLGIDGEHVLPVPPLSPVESVTLLTDRAAAVAPGFTVTGVNSEAVARLCTRLDGIPLAIELAATRLRTLSIDQLLQRLEDRFALLSVGSRVAAPRQRTLRATVDWSYGLCTPAEQRLWARLSVFTGGFDLDAAEAVCAGDGLERADILDLLDQLATQSLVTHRGARFGMLETIREYGQSRLAELGEQDTLRRRHRAYYLDLAVRGERDWCGPGQEQTLARVRAEHGNLRAAFEEFLTDPDGAEPALTLAAALRWHWSADGLISEGREWLERALARPAPDGRARADALWVGAWVPLLQGDQETARERLAECRRVAAATGDPVPAAHAASQAGTANLFRGDMPAAITEFRAAVDALETAGETAGVLHAQFQLAITLSHCGEHEQATAIARRAIDVGEARGEHLSQSYARWVLAFDTWRRGDPEQAHHLVLAALGLQSGFRDAVGAGLMIETLGWIAGSAGRPERAAQLLGTAYSIWRSIGTHVGVFGPPLGVHHDRCAAAATRALRPAAYRAAFEQGVQPTLEAAIGYALRQPTAVAPAPAGDDPGLTRREREIADLIAEGLSNRAIAQRLVLSTRTVDGHVQNLLAKLGFSSRSQVAAWVARVPVSGPDRVTPP